MTRTALSPARRTTRPLSRDARAASTAVPNAAASRSPRRRAGNAPTPCALWLARVGLALAVTTLLAPLPSALVAIETVASPVRWSLGMLIMIIGGAALAATVIAVLTLRAHAPGARGSVVASSLLAAAVVGLVCFAGILAPTTRTAAIGALIVWVGVVMTFAVVWTPWFLSTWGAILAGMFVWGILICFPVKLPTTAATSYVLVGLLAATLLTILLAREQAKRAAWARSSTQIVGGLALSATQVVATFLALLVAWVVLVPTLATTQWRPATRALATARTRLAQVNPLTTPGPTGPTVAAFGVVKSAPPASSAVASAPVVIRYHITTAPKGDPLAPRLDVVALDAVDANNIWSVGPAPTVDLAPSVTLTTTAALGNLTVGRITALSPLPGNYLPAFESAVRFSIPVEAQTLIPLSVSLAHGQSLVGVENVALPGDRTTPFSYTVTATAIVYVAAPTPFSASTAAYLTTIPVALRAPIQQTALTFAGGATDPRDLAATIEATMRKRWTLTSPQPARVGDAAVLSLLTTGRGDAYAWDTAYALMLRSLGIQTRLMEGYLPGTIDRTTGDQVIRASDATYWPQAALDASGWTTLDPVSHVLPVGASGNAAGGTTPGGHPVKTKATHPGATHPTPTPNPNESRATSAQTPPPPPIVPPAVVHRIGLGGAWLLLLGLILLVLAIALLLWRAWRRRAAPHPRHIVQPIRRLVATARLFGIPGVGRAKTTAQALRAITRATAGPDTLADQLASVYTTAVYAPPAVHLDASDVQMVAQSAARLWRALIYLRLTRAPLTSPSTRPSTRPSRHLPTSTRSLRHE